MKVKDTSAKGKMPRRNVVNRNPKIKHALEEKLAGMNKSTIDLPPLKRNEEAPSNRCRVCVRNLPPNVKNADIFVLFKDFGPIREILIKQEQRMLILTLSNRTSAERAVTYLNGSKYDNSVLIVRAFRIPAIKVLNLSKHVTNELLHVAFSIFGKIEECYILINQYGHCSGEGIVEYDSKQAMYAAIKFCRENSFFLTSSQIPVIAEQYDPICHYDGKPETLVNRTPSYYRERQVGPRVSVPGSYDDYYANRYKELYEEYKFAMNDMKEQFACEQERLRIECAKIKYDQETEELKMLIKEREKERKRLDNIRNQKLFKHGAVQCSKSGNRKSGKNKEQEDSISDENEFNDNPSYTTLVNSRLKSPGCGGDCERDYEIPRKRQRF